MNIMRKHQPWNVKIVSWDEIENKYNKLGFPYQSMLKLIQHIKSTGLAKRLFAYTSMHKLVVTIYDPGEPNVEALHIELNTNTMRWHFEYFPKPYEPSEMIRYCDDGELIARFDKYIQWLKW